MKWATRICITVFLLPFFGVGLFLTVGGGFAGSQGGMLTGLGVFGILIGLAFLALPTLMLIGVWSSSFKGPAAGVQASSEPSAPEREELAKIAMQTCSYCSRSRPVTETMCPSCGAR